MLILERPLSIQEAAQKSGRHVNTIKRWLRSGQLKMIPKGTFPMVPKHRVLIEPAELLAACRSKRVAFKQPRYPHLFRKREIDKLRWRTKYARTPEKKRYHREITRWRRAKRKQAR